mgnify:CR=1 FL=1
MYNQMVVHYAFADLTDEQVDRIFHALADATRRDIVRRTAAGKHSVSELADSYKMSFAAVQKHVSVLNLAGLVTKEQRGRERLVSANPQMIERAKELLSEFENLWRTRIDQLDALLAED